MLLYGRKGMKPAATSKSVFIISGTAKNQAMLAIHSIFYTFARGHFRCRADPEIDH